MCINSYNLEYKTYRLATNIIRFFHTYKLYEKLQDTHSEKEVVTEDSIEDKPKRYLTPENLTEQEIKEIDSICRNIARKRLNWSGLEFNDTVNDLWVKAIDVISTWTSLNPRLLYVCLNNKSFDLCRLAKKVADNQFAVEAVLPYHTVTSITFNVDFNANFKLKDFFKLFPERSRERKYLVFLAYYEGLGEYMDEDHSFKELFEGDCRRECELAKKLGFSNDTSNGYRSLKKRVKERILASGLY